MSKRKYMKLSILLALVLAITAVAAGNFGNAPVSGEEVPEKKKDPVQAALVREMQSLLQRFDSTHQNYDLNGSFTAIDKTDSVHALLDLPYIINRRGDAVYFRFGETESVHTAELSLYVDHVAKTMVLGGPKRILQGGMPAFNDLYDLIAGEEY
ncbi:MAG TPA: hypothetical protein VD996_04650, partial [Chitinophagaceae bacterium]|nr:hypothetical protein [Chitinophagaceae bacterium]